jgi:hypothetical protein
METLLEKEGIGGLGEHTLMADKPKF